MIIRELKFKIIYKLPNMKEQFYKIFGGEEIS